MNVVVAKGIFGILTMCIQNRIKFVKNALLTLWFYRSFHCHLCCISDFIFVNVGIIAAGKLLTNEQIKLRLRNALPTRNRIFADQIDPVRIFETDTTDGVRKDYVRQRMRVAKLNTQSGTEICIEIWR